MCLTCSKGEKYSCEKDNFFNYEKVNVNRNTSLLIDEDLITFLCATSHLSVHLSVQRERSVTTDVYTSVKDIFQPVSSFISPLSFVIWGNGDIISLQVINLSHNY